LFPECKWIKNFLFYFGISIFVISTFRFHLTFYLNKKINFFFVFFHRLTRKKGRNVFSSQRAKRNIVTLIWYFPRFRSTRVCLFLFLKRGEFGECATYTLKEPRGRLKESSYFFKTFVHFWKKPKTFLPLLPVVQANNISLAISTAHHHLHHYIVLVFSLLSFYFSSSFQHGKYKMTTMGDPFTFTGPSKVNFIFHQVGKKTKNLECV
jgi:hypothetical protein